MDPKTGWPLAFEAAARLGRAREVFCLYVVDADGERTVWCCALERTRGRKHGRGSQGRRKWREWWKQLAPVELANGAGCVKTDWFEHDERLPRAEKLGVPVYRADSMPDNVHILDANGNPTS